MTQSRLRLAILIVAAFAAANPLLAGRLDRGIGAGSGFASLFAPGAGR